MRMLRRRRVRVVAAPYTDGERVAALLGVELHPVEHPELAAWVERGRLRIVVPWRTPGRALELLLEEGPELRLAPAEILGAMSGVYGLEKLYSTVHRFDVDADQTAELEALSRFVGWRVAAARESRPERPGPKQ